MRETGETSLAQSRRKKKDDDRETSQDEKTTLDNEAREIEIEEEEGKEEFGRENP